MAGVSGPLRRPRSSTLGNLTDVHAATPGSDGDPVTSHRTGVGTDARRHQPGSVTEGTGSTEVLTQDQRSHSDNDLSRSARPSTSSTLVASSATYALEDPAGITLRWDIREETNANDWIGLYLYSEVDASKWIDYKNKGVNGAKKGEIVWKFDYIICHFVEPKTQVYFKYHSHTGQLLAASGAIIISKKVLYSTDEHQLFHRPSENFVRFVVRDIDAVHLRKGLFFNPDPYIKMWLEPAATAYVMSTRTGSGGGTGTGASHSGSLLAHHRRQQRTTVCEDTTAPAWPQQEFAFRALPDDVLYMKLMDKFVSSRPTLNRYLGHVILPVKTIQEKSKPGCSTPLTLNVTGRSPTDRVSGTLHLYVDLMSADAAVDHQHPLSRPNGDIGEEAESSSDDDEPSALRLTLPVQQGRRDVVHAGDFGLSTSTGARASGDNGENNTRDHRVADEDTGDDSCTDSNNCGLSSDDEAINEHVRRSQKGDTITLPGAAESSASATVAVFRDHGTQQHQQGNPVDMAAKLTPDDKELMVQQVYQALGRSPSFISSLTRIGSSPSFISSPTRSDDPNAQYLTSADATSSKSQSREQLPAGWSTAIDSCGRTYYVDRVHKTASWTLPETGLNSNWRNSMASMPTRSLPIDEDADSAQHQRPRSAEAAKAAAAKTRQLENSPAAQQSQYATVAATTAAATVGAGRKDADGDMAAGKPDSKGDVVPAAGSAATSAADHPALRFVTGNEFFTTVQEDSAAQAEYMSNAALRRTVQMIRSNPGAFERYIHNADLVSFINKFALTKSDLPPGWEQKVDRNGKAIFVNALAKWTSYIDPRMPITHVSVEPPAAVPLAQGRYKAELPFNGKASEYDSKVLAFLRQANSTDMLQARWPALKKNTRLKELIMDIIADGIAALQRYRNDVDFLLMLSLFENDIATYVAPQSSTADRSAQLLLSDASDDSYNSSPHAHLRHVIGVAPHKQGFQDKYRAFRKKLDGKGYGAGPQKMKLRIRRDSILQGAFNKIMSYSKKELQKSLLLVGFAGEEGLDYGGPAREFFFLLSRELFNPYYGLFEYSAYDTYTVQISPVSQFIDNASEWFRFAGRVLGLGIVHQYLMDCYFTRPFYKMLLGEPCSLSDLESLDPEFHQSLVWIRDNNISSCSLDLTFSVDEEAFGQIVEHELKPGGKNVVVTEKNKKDYIERMVKWRITRGITEQKQSLLRGFREALDPKLIAIFDAKELELVIAGTAEIDVDEWKRNTEYRSGYHAEHPVIKRFWECIEMLSNDQRLRLLQFVTGTSSVPFEGFAALRGSHGPRKFAVERWGEPESLPRAHTCFNRLDLPPYGSLAVLREKLLVAIEETSTFGVE